ncbi:MAG: valine--tRNA ligase [Candidatus Bipolaricaulota bacterium]|nr:valine--tRNA ligase [Candidatus Bipolaricaulota bacterium]
MDLSKRYQPADVEAKNYRFWEEGDYFRASVGVVSKVPFSIVIPPPNVTGRLHMGHALNNTLQDVVIRYRRMLGDRACWFPGTDHAGIATQNVVEKALAKEGTSRHELGRDAFVARVWDWKAKYGSEIIDQLKALGCSCDWSRLRFTLDEGLSKAVRHVFVRLYEDGLVYRGEYLVNWCPRCRTALSDLEVDHKDVDGALYYIRYPLEKGGSLTIATTRPETMLGDTAVAVHPQDERHKDLVGSFAVLPILGRRLPIVGSESVDPEFGTGTLKVTPGHDPVDFEIGKKEGLEFINILNGDGTLNAAAGPFEGMGRDEARKAVIERLRAEGALEKTEPYRHAVGHCERCDAAVEPLLSTQWFVRMQPLAEKAIAAVNDGRIEFVPERWTKLYFDWLENIRDWCISRQLWWGHRIPVWYGPDGREFVAETDAEAAARARKHYGHAVELRQDEDVLDTWFSSWLWPFSVMGWPEQTEDLKTFFPTSFLLTGFDILFFWVSRMVMASLYFMDDVPFRTVYITPLIVDDKGQKMSKSKGNSVDPIDLVGEYGADALRLAMARTTGKGRTVRMPWGDITEGRNFLNKIWNMARFVLMNLGDERPKLPKRLREVEDRYILSRLAATVAVARTHLDAYSFHLAVEEIYDFVWHDFCDWYLEIVKVRLANSPEDGVKGVLYHSLCEIVKLLHPFVPFVTEEIWQALGEKPGSVSIAAFPEAGARDEEAEAAMRAFQEIVVGVRSIRSELDVPASAKLTALVKTKDKALRKLLGEKEAALEALSGASSWTVAAEVTPPDGSARQVLASAELFVPLAEWIDIDAERARLRADLVTTESDLAKVEATLGNEKFLARAPEDVVEKERGKQAEFNHKRDRLQANLRSLGG